MSAARHLSIRNVPAEVAEALEAERRRRGASLNQTVIDLLSASLGVRGERFDNGLGRLAGRWDAEASREFEAITAGFGQIDAELWR